MTKTRHIQKRMAQRTIKIEMLKLVGLFGVIDGDKRILNRKGCDAALAELEQVKKDLIKARERGGFVVVNVDDVLITAYALDSYKRIKASNDPIY